MQILFWLSIGLDRRTPSEHLLVAIAEALIQKGHKVHVLQKDTGGDKGELPQKMVSLGVTTTRIKSNPSNRGNLIGRYVEDINYFLKCQKWLATHTQFKKIFLQSSNAAGVQVAILKKTLKGSEIIFNVQDIFPENAMYSGTIAQNGVAYKLLSSVQRYGYNHVDRIITISEDMEEQLAEIGVPSSKVNTIYNWSYQDKPYNRETLDYCKVAPLFDKEKFNVVYAGNIGRMQNVESVIFVADKMRDYYDITFHIFGSGVYRENLEKLAADLKTNNVIFHPMLSAEEAPALYSIADINIIPLRKDIYKTALPSKTATCLACGKPVILAIGTNSIFGTQLNVETGADLVDSNDIDGIEEAILKTKAKRSKQDAGNYFMEYFSKTINSNKYADLIIG